LNPGGEQLFLKFKAADAGQSDIQEQTNRAASEIRLAKLLGQRKCYNTVLRRNH
jgi:hypothetical protein